MIRLYRACTQLDKNNDFILHSKIIDKLEQYETLQEIISHELNSKTARGVYYSFTTNIEKAEYYLNQNGSIEIRYIDFDPENLPKTIISMHPIGDRAYLIGLIASCNLAMSNKMVINPANKNEHSLIGILNYSQRTVASWASSMDEVVLQVHGLQLKKLEINDNTRTHIESNELLHKYSKMRNLNKQSDVEKLLNYVRESFVYYHLKRRTLENYLLSIIQGAY